uniref:Uncharacterized protein n=1 Tax=Leersia perrieri TaxID=77586 RepID=A0A0D9W4N0_9ORYZ
MATSGDVDEMPEPGTDHPAEPCMAVGDSGDQLSPTTEEVISPPVAAETTTTSDHHEAARPEQSVERSTSESESEEQVPVPMPMVMAKEKQQEQEQQKEGAQVEEESARERLKRHRLEMAGRVWVPDMWGQEKLLKDWVDCAAFDRPLVPPDLLTARRALVAECCARRPDHRTATTPAASSPLREISVELMSSVRSMEI